LTPIIDSVNTESERFATPRVAAGVLFRDHRGRVLVVNPTYKSGWEIPGGYVERGESPRAAATREVKEELGLDVSLGALLVVDWAPHPREGDKMLIIFEGAELSDDQIGRIHVHATEISEARYVPSNDLPAMMPARLARRILAATLNIADPYLEHGSRPL